MISVMVLVLVYLEQIVCTKILNHDWSLSETELDLWSDKLVSTAQRETSSLNLAVPLDLQWSEDQSHPTRISPAVEASKRAVD